MIEGLGTQGMVWNSMLEHQAGLTDEVEAKGSRYQVFLQMKNL